MTFVLSCHAPDGSGGANRNFTGSITSYATGEYCDRVQIELRTSGGSGSLVWSTDFAVPNSQQTQHTYSVEPPGLLRSGVTYGWRARGHSAKTGAWTAWSSPYLTFTVVRSIPVASIVAPSGTLPNLAGTHFKVGYSDADGKPLGAFRIRVRPTTAPGDPAWDGTTNSWDTGTPATTSAETTAGQVDRLYGGAALPAGTYSWQAIVRDNVPGNWSDPVYGSFTTTQDATLSTSPAEDPTSQTERRWVGEKARIVIRTVNGAAGRGPGTVVAIIYDAQNIGASEFYNSGGEFYFTLPATHPQVAVIEPWQVHYALEVHQGLGWKEKSAGLIVDYNATENDVVFNGVDYMGLLGLMYDDRFNPTDTADKSVETGGSKYSDWAIHNIIKDQLDKEKARPNGILGFITVPAIGAGLEALQHDGTDTKVTIFATFKQRLPFIAGLIESHRAGSGHKTRLSVVKQTDGSYAWHLAENPGYDRDSLRLEYGGMLTGFNIIPFGDFKTKVYGIGKRVPPSSVMDYDIETAPNINESTYGAIPSVNLWQDTTDLNDLKRRVKQRAMNVAKVGKAMALGIRVDALGLKNGWDITDSIPVVVKRGVVDTTRFGSGYWTVWGWQWEYKPDGETNLTLSILPREDTSSPNPDLIPTRPIETTPEWQVGYTPPPPEATAPWWLDQTTGTVWKRGAPPIIGAGTIIHLSPDITITGHGRVAGDWVLLANLPPDSGFDAYTHYVVLAAGLTTDSFRLALTPGGSAIEATADGTLDATGLAPYTATAPGEVMAPPVAPAKATAPTLDSALVSGLVQLKVGVADTTSSDPTVRLTEVWLTHDYTGAVPSWTDPRVHTVPAGTTEVIIPAPGNTKYAVKVRWQNVYGQAGDFSDVAEYTTVAGNDALSSPATGLTGQIVSTQITDQAVTAPKLEANLVLASTIMTALSGRRVEVNAAGIRLYDTDDGIVVNIPTDGSPVYVEGAINAGTLDSDAAILHGNTDIDVGGVVTLDASVGAPTSAPTVGLLWVGAWIPPQNGNTPWGLTYSDAGGAGGTTEVFYAIGGGTDDGTVYELKASDRTVNRSFTLPVGLLPHDEHHVQSVCRLGTYLYVLDFAFMPLWGTVQWRVYRYIASTLAYDTHYVGGSDWYGISNGAGSPKLCSDGTNLWLADVGSTSGPGVYDEYVRFQKYDGSMVAVGSEVSTGYAPGAPIFAMEAGDFDFIGPGAWKLACAFQSATSVELFGASGTRASTFSFACLANTTSLTFGDVGGLGAVFYSAASSAHFKHTTWVGGTYYFGYSWYDSVGTTHETSISPRATFVVPARSRVVMSTPHVPGGGGADEPNSVRMYIGTSATPGALWLHYSGTVTAQSFSEYDPSGTHDGTGTPFPAGSAAELKSAEGGFSVKGDGTLATSNLIVTSPSAGAPIVIKRAGDSANRLDIYDDGKLEWGPGNDARDTNLYRGNPHLLKTDDAAHVVGDLYVGAASGQPPLSVNGRILLGYGSDWDTPITRAAAAIVAAPTLRGSSAVQVGTNPLWRYVPLATYIQAVADASTTTSTITLATVAEMTGLPAAGVKAVLVQAIGNASVIAVANRVDAVDYGRSDGSSQVQVYMPVAGYYAVSTGMVLTGGTNNRQFQYTVVRSAGTITYYLRVMGYWIDRA